MARRLVRSEKWNINDRADATVVAVRGRNVGYTSVNETLVKE